MKKIVCPQCGAVNLEKFISFPNCAGCATRLPQDESVRPDPFWRRPLRVWLWVVLTGGAAIGALGAAAWFQTEPPRFAQLMVYGQAPRRVTVGRAFVCRLTLDEIFDSSPSRRFRNVRVRLPNSSDDAFEVMAIAPPSDEKITLGIARYFQFRSLPNGSVLALTLRAREVGEHRLSVIVHADAHYSAQYRSVLIVLPRRKTPGSAPASKS